jgi:hypothetical protein
VIQAALEFGEPAPASGPAPCDPHLAEPLRRIQQEHNRRLASRLLHGPIDSDELDACKALYGKRGASRLHDVKAWLQYLGCAKPIERTTIDAVRGLYTWALTEEARELARAHMFSGAGVE